MSSYGNREEMYIDPEGILKDLFIHINTNLEENEIYNPRNKQLRELYQGAMLTYLMNIYLGEKWFFSLMGGNNTIDFSGCQDSGERIIRYIENCDSIEDHSIDFEACIKRDDRVECVRVQSMMVDGGDRTRDKTDNFSENGIAQFIYEKKLSKVPHTYSEDTIFGIYFNFTQNVNFPTISHDVSQRFEYQNQIWIFGGGRNPNKMFLGKLHPNENPAVYEIEIGTVLEPYMNLLSQHS